MSKIILYHGSQEIVKEPKLELGKKNNDFGQGFYCTRIIERGKEWACKESLFGILNKYELDLEGLKILDLTKVKFPSLTWICLLINNRKFDKDNDADLVLKELDKLFSVDTSDYDLIIGYRADDSYFSFAQAFLSNSLAIQSLSYVLSLGHLGLQYFLKSEKAFKQLKFLDFENVTEEFYYAFKDRDQKAREDYKKYMNEHKIDDNDLFVREIIKKGFDLNDPRLR